MKLNPDWICGFVDGEGCFHVSIQKHPEMSVGYQVMPEFTVVQHERDIQILYGLKKFFSAGVVRRNHEDRYAYQIRKLECLEWICDFFLKHPLKTKKNVDFRKFRKVILIIKERRHLSKEGLLEIIDIAFSMNTANRKALLRIKENLSCG
jgi:hypothetical protein